MLRVGRTRHRAPNRIFTPRHNGGGFTLIELVIVASLISILAVLSTPLFRAAYSNLELKDSAYNIGKMMRYAGTSAVMEERAYKIVFDFEKSAYRLLAEDQKNSEGIFKKAEGRFGGEVVLPAGLSLSGNENEVIFLPNGRSAKAAITVIDKAKKKGFDIKTTGRTGRIEISDVSEK